MNRDSTHYWRIAEECCVEEMDPAFNTVEATVRFSGRYAAELAAEYIAWRKVQQKAEIKAAPSIGDPDEAIAKLRAAGLDAWDEALIREQSGGDA